MFVTVGSTDSDSSKTAAKGTQKSPSSVKSGKSKKSRGLKIGGAIAGVLVIAAGSGVAVVVNNNRQIVVDGAARRQSCFCSRDGCAVFA